MSDSLISSNDQYTKETLLADFAKFGGYGIPFPLILSEVYKNKRIFLFSTEEICNDFYTLFGSFSFYKQANITFCSDKPFVYNKNHLWLQFVNIENIAFKSSDFVLLFDLDVKAATVEKIKAKGVSNVCLIKKSVLNALFHYATAIRPVKQLLQKYPKLQVILTDNRVPPSPEKRTDWERYIAENSLTREKMVAKLKAEEYPYPKGLYNESYSAADIVEMNTVPKRVCDYRGVVSLSDFESKYINVSNGMRNTAYQPQEYDRTIHIFGGCGWFGVGHADHETFPSQLQLLLNKNVPEEKIIVRNRASFIWGKHDIMWYSINSTDFSENDIVVIPGNYKWARFYYSDIPNMHYVDISEREDSDGEVFVDAWHPSESGLKSYARNLFDFLKENNFLRGQPTIDAKFVETKQIKEYGVPAFSKISSSMLSNEHMKALDEYLQDIKKLRPRIGSIVMNCNPFTLGHRYLIEYASKQVEHLYVFAVEEDKSFFPFKDRIELIRKGTADLENVTVLPSGKFIISSITFTDYFGKQELQDKTIDPSLDVSLFGKHIAPALGINVRFAGEEPLDKVTLQYNRTMEKILPQYGIEFVVVQRKVESGAVISASRVRKLLNEQNFAEIKRIVPITTYEYLLKNYKIDK